MIHQFGLATASGSDGSPRPLEVEVWLNGLRSVILISVCSNMGALMVPFRRRTWYKRLQVFHLGLAFGSSSTMWQLISMVSAFDLKATSIFVCEGMYQFFLIRALAAGFCLLMHISRLALTITQSDRLMNFIEGLAIYASFTVSVNFVISTSVAMLLLKLSDFAILLDTGMSIKEALHLNFMSACFCYLGVEIIKDILSCQIAAMTGGIYLYIALASMSPEMNEVSKTTIILNAILLSGLAFMLFLTTYSGQLMG